MMLMLGAYFCYFCALLTVVGSVCITHKSSSLGKPRNIILLVVDSLRYDTVYDKNVGMPYVEENSTKFHQARSAGCWTLPATTSMFTGKMPHEHGATSQTRTFDKKNKALAEVLKEEGYNTYQATANIVTTEIFGVNRGFDETHKLWDHVEAKFRWLLRFLLIIGKPRVRKTLLSQDDMFQKLASDLKVGICWSQATYDEAFSYVRKKMQKNEAKNEKSFFFVNLMEAHFPYHVAPTFKLTADNLADKIREWKAIYDTLNQTFLQKKKNPTLPRIEKMMRNRQYKGWEMLANPIDEFIKEMHKDKDNLVILCSDHGDNFGDQDWVYHFSNVTEAGNRVPFFWLDHNEQQKQDIHYPISSRYLYNDILRSVGIENGEESLFKETPLSAPILQSYWYNADKKTLPKYRFNQMAFLENGKKFVYRDDVDRKFKWMQTAIPKDGEGEAAFEPVDETFDPIEEAVQDNERKAYLKKNFKDFKVFSDGISKEA